VYHESDTIGSADLGNDGQATEPARPLFAEDALDANLVNHWLILLVAGIHRPVYLCDQEPDPTRHFIEQESGVVFEAVSNEMHSPAPPQAVPLPQISIASIAEDEPEAPAP
jgi:hypothetical protein